MEGLHGAVAVVGHDGVRVEQRHMVGRVAAAE